MLLEEDNYMFMRKNHSFSEFPITINELFLMMNINLRNVNMMSTDRLKQLTERQ